MAACPAQQPLSRGFCIRVAARSGGAPSASGRAAGFSSRVSAAWPVWLRAGCSIVYRSLAYFLGFPEFGSILTYKLLNMILVVFFSILAFSNVVTALSTFYLSEDLDRIVAAPIAAHTFFYARFVDTLLESSWMIVMFAVPAFLAYGVSHDAGPAYYLVAALTLPPFL
jgi:hypothetical protein